jgi:putative nucleotidyltransferase with HDIG domain
MFSRPADLLKGSVTVASPPAIYQKLVTVINDPRSSSSHVAAVIAEDSGLTARLLKIVNSAFFSFPRRIETVTHAVTVVGTSQIRDLALATSVMTLFRDVPRELVDMEKFWHHSLAVGVTARVLAGHRREENVERFFVAGLLHDLGRLLMFMRAGTQAGEAVARAESTGMPLYRAEREVFGFTHAQVGSALLDQWNFPGAFREATAYHHQPRRASRYPVETAAVHVSDVVANGLRWGHGGEPRTPDMDESAWTLLGVDASVIPIVLGDAQRQMEAAVQLLATAA